MTDYVFDFSNRDAQNNADSLFVQRWSPRAFEKTSIDDATLERIMQAARLSQVVSMPSLGAFIRRLTQRLMII